MNPKNRQRSLGTGLLILAAITFLGPPAGAQTTTGKLQGVVKDQGGAALPGITVTAVNLDSGLKRVAVTSQEGNYLLILAPGPYKVSAASAAHEESAANVRLQVGAILDQNFTLKPGKMIAQEVAVVAASVDVTPASDLKSTEIATNVSELQMQALPQPTRNFLNFAALAPGFRLSIDEQN